VPFCRRGAQGGKTVDNGERLCHICPALLQDFGWQPQAAATPVGAAAGSPSSGVQSGGWILLGDIAAHAYRVCVRCR
jgi:hypothetical protein